jgi:hypothetical protein
MRRDAFVTWRVEPGSVLRHLPLGFVLLAWGAFALLPGVARSQEAPDVPSVFFIAKSENKNQVHYGVHLDASCAPLGRAPVFAYWRMLEHGPRATEPLLEREIGAYGFADQRVLTREPHGGRVEVRLRALPGRPIVIDTTAGEGGSCVATATTTIGGVPASLASVYAKLGWPFGVDYLVLSGRGLADGRELRERIRP